MSDIASPEVEIWQALESTARGVLRRFDFRELRTPILEETSVYLHSLGDSSEIVTKQMYAFETRGGKQVCMRPEGTAGVMRHLAGRGQEAQEARVYYIGPMFRAERPQAGRRRQFHQLGVECIAPASPQQDAEIIAMQAALFEAWEVGPVTFQLNTRGSREDFPRILDGLRAELAPVKECLCEDCQRRLEENVLRVLDCKVPGCREQVANLPPITTWMAPESIAYFDGVCDALTALKVPFTVNPLLVRGLDYYQHTIWEVTSTALGAQDALSGGGRYQMAMGKTELEGVGFGIGMERVLLALSEARQAALTFNLMQERIREQVQQRGRMLAAVSHDLRTPLARLKLRVEQIEEPKLHGQMTQDLNDMIAMLDATLTYLNEQRTSEALQYFDVQALIESLTENAQDNGDDVQSSGACRPLKSQPMALRSCLHNLIDNALRYAGHARVMIEDASDRLVVRVVDSGPGIPANLREAVFEPFYRVEGSRNRNSGGVGIGMTIAREAARRMGGDLRLEETPGGGLTAVLDLPRI